MVITTRDRALAENTWDAAAAELWNSGEENAAEHLYGNNPWRAEGTAYCITCGEATTKHTMNRSVCGSCGHDY